MSDPIVRVSGLTKRFGKSDVLRGVDLEVGPGEFLGLVGVNGAGKTSLLRACAGLLAVVEGEADVLGHDLTDTRARRVAVTLDRVASGVTLR